MDEMRLDDELRNALNVDPSPEFLARVRTRIAAEPTPARWRLAWVAAPSVAVGVVVFALAVAPTRPEPTPTPPRAEAAFTPRPSPEAIAPEPETTVRGVAQRAVQRPAVAHATIPEVVVSRDERRALEFVEAIVSHGRVADLSVDRVDVVLEAVTLRDVEITPLAGLAPLRIEPLQIARLESGEPQ